MSNGIVLLTSLFDAWERYYKVPVGGLKAAFIQRAETGTLTSQDRFVLSVVGIRLDALEAVRQKDALSPEDRSFLSSFLKAKPDTLDAIQSVQNHWLVRLGAEFNAPQIPNRSVEGFSPEAQLQAYARITQATAEGKFSEIEVQDSDLVREISGSERTIILNAANDPNVGSFKWRGALNALLALAAEIMLETGDSFEEVASGILAIVYSHGNAANGTGEAVRQMGFGNMVVVMPSHSSTQIVKIQKCLNRGNVVILHGDSLTGSELLALQLHKDGLKPHFTADKEYHHGSLSDKELLAILNSNRTVILYGKQNDPEVEGKDSNQKNRVVAEYLQDEFADRYSNPKKRLLIPPYDNPDVSKGQGSIVMEAAMQFPDILLGAWEFVTPAGGLGLFNGLLGALLSINAEGRVTGNNTYEMPVALRLILLLDYVLALSKKEIKAKEPNTAAEGIAVARTGESPSVNIIEIKKSEEEAANVNLVSERETRRAMVFAHFHPWYGGKTLDVEGAFASALAAELGGANKNAAGTRRALVLSGVNIDKTKLDEYIEAARWIKEDLEFFKFTCKVCQAIRADNSPFTQGQIEAFNDLLDDPKSLAVLRSEVDRLGAKQALLVVLHDVKRKYYADKPKPLTGVRRYLKDFMGVREISAQDLHLAQDTVERIVVSEDGENEPTLSDLRNPESMFFRVMATLDRKKHYVFLSKTGRAARMAAWIAKRAGIGKVFVLKWEPEASKLVNQWDAGHVNQILDGPAIKVPKVSDAGISTPIPEPERIAVHLPTATEGAVAVTLAQGVSQDTSIDAPFLMRGGLELGDPVSGKVNPLMVSAPVAGRQGNLAPVFQPKAWIRSAEGTASYSRIRRRSASSKRRNVSARRQQSLGRAQLSSAIRARAARRAVHRSALRSAR